MDKWFLKYVYIAVVEMNELRFSWISQKKFIDGSVQYDTTYVKFKYMENSIIYTHFFMHK